MSGFDVGVWTWPQWTYAVLIGLNLLTGAVLDGQPRTGLHRFSVSLIGNALGFGILLAGGFWA